MNPLIASFLAVGAAFGLLSFRHQHRFSEGAAPRDHGGGGLELGPRLLWTAVCSCLWPLLLVSGAYGWWHGHRAARAATRRQRPM